MNDGRRFNGEPIHSSHPLWPDGGEEDRTRVRHPEEGIQLPAVPGRPRGLRGPALSASEGLDGIPPPDVEMCVFVLGSIAPRNESRKSCATMLDGCEV